MSVPEVQAVAPVGRAAGVRSGAVAVTATAVATAALCIGAAISAAALLIAVAAVQGVLVLTWTAAVGASRMSAVPDAASGADDARADAAAEAPTAVRDWVGTLVIGAAAAGGADVAASVRPHDALAPMLVVLGLTVPVMFVHQLVRGVVRTRVVESLSGTAVLAIAAVALSALLQLRHEFEGARLATAAAAVAGVAVVLAGAVDLGWARPRFDPHVQRGLTGVLAGVVGGTLTGVLVLRPLTRYGSPVAAPVCAVVAAAAALLSVSASMIDAGLQSRSGSGRVRALPFATVAAAILPLALVAPVAYLLLLVR